MKKGYSWLNSKEVKRLKQVLVDNFDCDIDFEGFAFAMNQKNKVYMINRDVDSIDFNLVRINTIGMYFGELKENEIRLSLEASEIVARTAKKNIIDVDDAAAARWLRGEELELEGIHKGFVILRRKNDILGCSKHKNDILMNFVPKERRIRSVD